MGYKAPSTTALIASDRIAPTHTPIANGRTSRSHSGQPLTARLVARNALTCPMANHSDALKKMANMYAEVDETAGTPSIGKTGTAAINTRKPITPRIELGSATSTKPNNATAAEIATAMMPPR